MLWCYYGHRPKRRHGYGASFVAPAPFPWMTLDTLNHSWWSLFPSMSFTIPRSEQVLSVYQKSIAQSASEPRWRRRAQGFGGRACPVPLWVGWCGVTVWNLLWMANGLYQVSLDVMSFSGAKSFLWQSLGSLKVPSLLFWGLVGHSRSNSLWSCRLLVSNKTKSISCEVSWGSLE